jgi:hypothetical protein
MPGCTLPSSNSGDADEIVACCATCGFGLKSGEIGGMVWGEYTNFINPGKGCADLTFCRDCWTVMWRNIQKTGRQVRVERRRLEREDRKDIRNRQANMSPCNTDDNGRDGITPEPEPDELDPDPIEHLEFGTDPDPYAEEADT